MPQGREDGTALGIVIGLESGALVLDPRRSEVTGPEIAVRQLHDEFASWDLWMESQPPFTGPGWAADSRPPHDA